MMSSINEELNLNPRIQSQLNTPKKWIVNNRMFRIKSWEIEEPEIRSLLDTLIVHKYYLNVIRNKERVLQKITLLLLTNDEDVEKIRTTLLITSSGTELRKTAPLRNNVIPTRQLKTTAPIWLTYSRLMSIFSKYNTDMEYYDLPINHTIVKNVRYPLIRFHPTTVDRHGKLTKVHVVYIEFSPKISCQYDSFVALSMEHRSEIKNNISGDVETLMFDKWTVEKPIKKILSKPMVKLEELAETKKEDVIEVKKKKIDRIY